MTFTCRNVFVLALLVVWGGVAQAQTSPSFVDVGAEAGLTAEGQHHAVAIGDYDNDGD